MHVFSVRLERVEPAISVLVAQFSNESSLETLFEDIYNGYPTQRLEADAIIVRPDVRDVFDQESLASAIGGNPKPGSTFLAEVSHSREVSSSPFLRFSTLPVFVLFGDGHEVHLSANISTVTEVPSLVASHLAVEDVIKDLREAEFRFLMEKSNALLPPVENTYYQNPSGRPARSFLRVGNVQYSSSAIDAATFWLLPHVFDAQALLIDTWSLSSIAFNVSRVLSAIRGATPIAVEMLSAYPTEKNEREAGLPEILNRLAWDATEDAPRLVTCLVSVTHTGSLVDVLDYQAEVSGLFIKLVFVAIFQLAKSDKLEALCDLSNDNDFHALSEGDVAGRSSIAIDEKTYFPLSYRDFEHSVMKAQADPFRPFVDMVRGMEILSVHRDHRDDGPLRHHAIHIDTQRLVEIPEFQAEFEKCIGALTPPPSVILSPKHAVAQRLSSLASDYIEKQHGFRPQMVSHVSLNLSPTGTVPEDQDIRDTLLAVKPDSAILTLDDCYVTGARMSGYQTRLRQMNIQARLHYMVAVARPERPAAWRDFCRKLSFRAPEDRVIHKNNTVTAVFEVSLPNWSDDKCPWCKENLFYDGLLYKHEKLPIGLDKRSVRLADTDQGLRNDLFLDPEAGPIVLYPGSVFAPPNSSQAEVFTAVAAAIHQLRVTQLPEKPLLGKRRHPIATVLSASDYLHDTYTDTIIRASFLRGAQPDELVYTDKEKEKTRTAYVQKLIKSGENDVSNLALELILAAALQKCSMNKDIHNPKWAASVGELLAMLDPIYGGPQNLPVPLEQGNIPRKSRLMNWLRRLAARCKK